jgi:hypothetical protein
MSVIKSVALDEKTAAIAKDMPNFSHFVRECLLRYHVNAETFEGCINPYMEEGSPGWLDTGRCNPASKEYMCFSCWPNGRPPRHVIKEFTSRVISLDQLDTKTMNHNRHLFTMGGKSIQFEDSEPVTPKKTLWKRLKALLP